MYKQFLFYVAIWWIVLALVRIPFVESWAIIPDGNPSNWWNVIGLRLVIAGACFALVYCRHEIKMLKERGESDEC